MPTGGPANGLADIAGAFDVSPSVRSSRSFLPRPRPRRLRPRPRRSSPSALGVASLPGAASVAGVTAAGFA